MAAVPAGYEAFQSFRRKAITLICFLLASSMAIGITVYVDSYSVHEWDKNLDIGEIAITITGYNLERYVDDIQDISGITRAAGLRRGHGNLFIGDNESITLDVWGDLLTPDEEFLTTFPNYINIESGRLPEISNEIALIDSLRIYDGVEIGDNLTLDQYDGARVLTIVGFYTHAEEASSPYFWRYSSIAIVVPSVVDDYDEDYSVLADVNRAPLTPFNPTSSLQYLSQIDESIRLLDPRYTPGYTSSQLQVQNRLSSGISAYMSWVQMLRIGQMLRASSVIFLLMLVTFLAIRHNVNERRYEENMLMSRGAAKGDLEKATTREVFTLSILSCFIGIPLGLLLSRVAISATGFFAFNPALVLSEPVLISLDSLLISAVVTIALPMLVLGGYRAIYSTKKSVDEDRGRLAKVSRGLGIIRWDLLIVAISGLFLVAMLSGGSVTTSDPILALILLFIPIPLFLGISSLSMKALRLGANRLSRMMRRIVGDIPASIGIRKIGKGASSAGAASMILVLAICLSWNSAIIDASIPVTAMNQSRLSVGADLTFALGEAEYERWDEFVTNVTNHELFEAGTYVSKVYLYLSAGWEGRTNFLAVNPREYIDIGYDYLGNPLNESDLSSLLENLESSPDGAIITTDIALAYEFAVGDIVRTTTLEENAETMSFRVIGITDSLPELPDNDDYRDPYGPYFSGAGYHTSQIINPYYYGFGVVGTRKILVNRDYLGSQFTLHNQTNNYYCVRTTPNANASIIAEDVFSAGGDIVLYNGIWEAVSQNVDAYLSNTAYKMERALDTMLTVLTVGTIIGGFTIYAVEGIRGRKREIALLRSIGASTRTIIMALGTEMLVLMLFSMILLAIYAPLFLSTSIYMAGGSTTGFFDIYPIAIFPVIPWTTIFVVLGFFVVTVAFFIIIIAAFGSRINLAYTLNAAWAEADPYGGDV
ncbi:MAG: FtsX-like permease family protein [Candidatus Thorarchaeota archaeon]